MMIYLRAAYRLIFGFVLLTFLGALVAVIAKWLGFKLKSIFKVYNAWKRAILFTLNIQVETIGEPPTEPGILMANHRSYVDIALTPAKIPFTIVAKKSVSKWPLVGQGGRAIQTIWVDRENKDSRQQTRKEMKDRLQNGGSVLIFPEGTTSTGPGILELKPGMFFACAEGGFPIHTFAIEYEDKEIAWIGDDLFLPHFVRHFGKRKIRVKVKYGPVFSGSDGEQLRKDVAEWLDQTTRQLRDDWDNG